MNSRSGLLAWQWQGYARYHQARANLVLHIFLVPVFLAGNVAWVVGLLRLDFVAAAAGLLAMVASMALQGRGHRNEAVSPEPFTSAGNAFARILLEQWITFPRFVFSGGWIRALRAAHGG